MPLSREEFERLREAASVDIPSGASPEEIAGILKKKTAAIERLQDRVADDLASMRHSLKPKWHDYLVVALVVFTLAWKVAYPLCTGQQLPALSIADRIGAGVALSILYGLWRWRHLS
jgi:hypothetical protein